MDNNFNKELIDTYINKAIQKVVREDLLTECDIHHKLGKKQGYQLGFIKGFAVGIIFILVLYAIIFYF